MRQEQLEVLHHLKVLTTRSVQRQNADPAANSCVFSGLTPGTLYRLQVLSWSRGLSSDSSVLARTG